jgi:hypothetical protein
MDDLRLGPIDDTLKQLEAGLSAMTANLVDLEAATTTHLAGAASLSGETAARAEEALALVGWLWSQYLCLQQVVQEARGLRSSRRHPDRPRVEQLEQLVTGQSVLVTPVPSAVGDRLALPTTAVSMSPCDLRDTMERALEAARTDVTTIEEAWAEGLGRLERLTADWQSLTVSAAGLDDDDDPDLISAGELVRAAALAMSSDPLSQTEALDEADTRLGRARSRLSDLASRREGLPARLDAAHRLLEAVAELAAEGRAAGDRAREKIADPRGLESPLSAATFDDERRGLRPWLKRLSAAAAKGAWREAGAGLDEWERAAVAAQLAAQRVVAANSAPLNVRAELRGRLDALSAKAARLGLAEDPAVTALRAQARAMLYSAPCDLQRADALVNSLAVTLSRQQQTSSVPEPGGPGERRR